jgi:hypothetical protein
MAKDAPADWAGKILHARLTVGDTELLFGTLAEGGTV